MERCVKTMDKEYEIIKVISSVSPFSDEDISLEDELASIGIDSLKKVELIVAIEDAFSIVFEDADLDPVQLVSVSDFVKLAEKYLNR